MQKLVVTIMVIFITSLNAKSEIFNVKNFGAIGNGKTDDTKAIQKAIDAASVIQESIIFFPKGTYLLTKYISTNNYLENYFLRVHSNITFRGEGAVSVIKIGDHLFDKKDTIANAHLFYGIGIKNLQFNNLMIDLNGANNLVPEGSIKNHCAIFINHGNNIIIKQVAIKNASGTNMIIILGTGNNLLIENNIFLNGGHNVGSSIENKYQIDFSFVYCEWDSTKVINNLIKQENIDLALNSISGGIEIHGSNCYAAENTIIGCSPGLYISSSWHPMENTTVEKNRFEQCARGISFWVTHPMNNITIRDNNIELAYFRNWKSYTSNGIEMPNGNTNIYDSKHANGALVNNLVISNNIISAPALKNNQDRTAAIIIHSVKKATISNNVIKGMNFGGVIVQGSKWGSSNVSIEQNQFLDFVTNYDVISPAAYVVVFDSYILTDKNAPGIKNISVKNNDFIRTKNQVYLPDDSNRKKGRFVGIFIALPDYMRKEVEIKNNQFTNNTENVEFQKTN